MSGINIENNLLPCFVTACSTRTGKANSFWNSLTTSLAMSKCLNSRPRRINSILILCHFSKNLFACLIFVSLSCSPIFIEIRTLFTSTVLACFFWALICFSF